MIETFNYWYQLYFRKVDYDSHIRYNKASVDYHLQILKERFLLEGIIIDYKHRRDSIEFAYKDGDNWIFLMVYYHDTGYEVPHLFKVNNFKSFLYNKLNECLKEQKKRVNLMKFLNGDLEALTINTDSAYRVLLAALSDKSVNKSKIYCFDIDGTLCEEEPFSSAVQYLQAAPKKWVIEILKYLYNNNQTIYLNTARPEIDREITVEWLKLNSIPYHKLFMGKPKADFYIDDRALDIGL